MYNMDVRTSLARGPKWLWEDGTTGKSKMYNRNQRKKDKKNCGARHFFKVDKPPASHQYTFDSSVLGVITWLMQVEHSLAIAMLQAIRDSEMAISTNEKFKHGAIIVTLLGRKIIDMVEFIESEA